MKITSLYSLVNLLLGDVVCNTGCFVKYNACYVLYFVTAIILRHTKNIYEISNCKPYRLKANFLTNTVM